MITTENCPQIITSSPVRKRTDEVNTNSEGIRKTGVDTTERK